MQQQSVLDPYHLIIQNEADIITMRQEVRQIARGLGLSLTQQAKITAAISGIARSFMILRETVAVTIQVSEGGSGMALEIQALWQGKFLERADLERTLDLSEARLLVNEAEVSLTPFGTRIALRMWLN